MADVETWFDMYYERINSARVILKGDVNEELVLEELHMAVEGLVKGCYRHVHGERPPDSHDTLDIVEEIPLLERQVSKKHKRLLNILRESYGRRYPNDLSIGDYNASKKIKEVEDLKEDFCSILNIDY